MIFLGLKFWPKVIFFSLSMNDTKIFWVAKKKIRGISLGCKKSTKGIFWGMPEKVLVFLGRQILKLGYFGV